MPWTPSISSRSIKSVTLTAALLTGTALIAATVSNQARGLARAEVARLVARTPGLSVGAVDMEMFGGALTIRDVAFARGSLHVYARTLSLPTPKTGLASLAFVTSAHADEDRSFRVAQWPRTETPTKDAPPPEDGGIELKIPGQGSAAKPASPDTAGAPTPAAALGSASATDVTIVSGTQTITIKKIDLSGTPLTNADLATLLDPKGPDTIGARLKKVTAGSIVVPSITGIDKDGATFELKDLLFANVVEGKIEAASIASTMSSKKTPTSDTVSKTGAIQASDLDLALLMQIAETKRADDTVPLKTLARTFSIADVSNVVHDPAGSSTTTIAAITEKDIKARPLKIDGDKLAVAGDPQATARNEKAFADDLIGSFAFDAVSLDRLKVSMPDQKDPSDVSIGRIALETFKDRTLGGLAVRDILVKQASGKASVATVDVTNIIVPLFDRPSADASRPTAEDVPSIGKFDLTGFDIDSVVKSDDDAARHIKFKVAHVGATGDQTAGTSVKKGSLAVDNVTFDVPADTPIGKQFDTMGYGHIDLSSAMDATFDQGKETLVIPKFQINGVNMGSLNLAADLASVSKNISSSNQKVSQAAALAILVKHLDIMIVNKGLADKALELRAKQDGTTVTEERDSVIVFVSNLAQSLGEDQGLKAIKSALVAFIKDSKSLHITATSKDGFGAADVAMFTSPDDLLSRLSIKAEANQ